MGAVAEQHLRRPAQLRPDHHLARRAVRPRQLRQARLLLGLRVEGLQRRCTTRSRPPRNAAERNKLLGDAQSMLADGRGQRLPVPAAVADRRQEERKGLWKDMPIFVQRPVGAVAGREHARMRTTRCTTCRRSELVAALPRAQPVAGRGRAGGARPHRALGAAPASHLPAAARGRRWSRRAPPRRAGSAASRCGPLDGVPITIKENIATRGDPMPPGTAAVELAPAAADAPPAARLREAGAVIVSKTTMPDYGMLSSGLSSFHTLARNPWDLTQARRAAPAPAPAPRPRPATARCTSAPTSAARCACRPAGAASSRSSPASAASRSTRPTWAAPPGR